MYTLEEVKSWWQVPAIAHFFSLFKSCFSLTDVTIEELEIALQNDGTDEQSTMFISNLLVELLRGCYNNPSISITTYHEMLVKVLKERWEEVDGRINPLSSINSDFHNLPTLLKVHILHRLTEYRLESADVATKLAGIDPSDLRLESLGSDRNESSYWYFFGIRLYKETPEKNWKELEAKPEKKCGNEKCAPTSNLVLEENFVSTNCFKSSASKRHKKKKKWKNKERKDCILGGVNSCRRPTSKWEVVCSNVNDWEKLAVWLDCKNPCEATLRKLIIDNFLPNLPKIADGMKEQELQKVQVEIPSRRSSCRILAKKLCEDDDNSQVEKMKKKQQEIRRKEEEVRRKEQEVRMLEGFEKLLQNELRRKRKEDFQKWMKENKESRHDRIVEGIDSDSSSNEKVDVDEPPVSSKSICRTKTANTTDPAGTRKPDLTASKKVTSRKKTSVADRKKQSSTRKKRKLMCDEELLQQMHDNDNEEVVPELKGLTKPAQSPEYSAMWKAWEAVDEHPESWQFQTPVEEWYAPGYHNIIKRPMDLTTIEHKLKCRSYNKVIDFTDDVTLMFNNCRLYNGPESEYTTVANELDSIFKAVLYTSMMEANCDNSGSTSVCKHPPRVQDESDRLSTDEIETDEAASSSDEFVPSGVSRLQIKTRKLELSEKSTGSASKKQVKPAKRPVSAPTNRSIGNKRPVRSYRNSAVKARKVACANDSNRKVSQQRDTADDVTSIPNDVSDDVLSTNQMDKETGISPIKLADDASSVILPTPEPVVASEQHNSHQRVNCEISSNTDTVNDLANSKCEKPPVREQEQTLARDKSSSEDGSLVDASTLDVHDESINKFEGRKPGKDVAKVETEADADCDKVTADSAVVVPATTSRSHSLEKFERLEADAKAKPQVLWSLDYLASQARVLEEQNRCSNKSETVERSSSQTVFKPGSAATSDSHISKLASNASLRSPPPATTISPEMCDSVVTSKDSSKKSQKPNMKFELEKTSTVGSRKKDKVSKQSLTLQNNQSYDADDVYSFHDESSPNQGVEKNDDKINIVSSSAKLLDEHLHTKVSRNNQEKAVTDAAKHIASYASDQTSVSGKLSTVSVANSRSDGNMSSVAYNDKMQMGMSTPSTDIPVHVQTKLGDSSVNAPVRAQSEQQLNRFTTNITTCPSNLYKNEKTFQSRSYLQPLFQQTASPDPVVSNSSMQRPRNTPTSIPSSDIGTSSAQPVNIQAPATHHPVQHNFVTSPPPMTPKSPSTSTSVNMQQPRAFQPRAETNNAAYNREPAPATTVTMGPSNDGVNFANPPIMPPCSSAAPPYHKMPLYQSVSSGSQLPPHTSYSQHHQKQPQLHAHKHQQKIESCRPSHTGYKPPQAAAVKSYHTSPHQDSIPRSQNVSANSTSNQAQFSVPASHKTSVSSSNKAAVTSANRTPDWGMVQHPAKPHDRPSYQPQLNNGQLMQKQRVANPAQQHSRPQLTNTDPSPRDNFNAVNVKSSCRVAQKTQEELKIRGKSEHHGKTVKAAAASTKPQQNQYQLESSKSSKTATFDNTSQAQRLSSSSSLNPQTATRKLSRSGHAEASAFPSYQGHNEYMGYHVPPTPAPTPQHHNNSENDKLLASNNAALLHHDLAASATLRALQQQHKGEHASSMEQHHANMLHYAAAAAAQQSQDAAAAEQYSRLAAASAHRGATPQHSLARVYYPTTHQTKNPASTTASGSHHLANPWLQATGPASAAAYPGNLLPPHMDPAVYHHFMQQTGMPGQYPMLSNPVMQQFQQQHFQHHMLPKY